MRLRAEVGRTTGATKHYRAHVDDRGVVVKDEQIAAPAFVEIVSSDDNFFLLCLDAPGKCVADTWHATLEGAKAQARFEFDIHEEDWERARD